MNIVQETVNGVSICTVDGIITMDTSPRLREVFLDLVDQGAKKILIDFASVPYIDSSGLATLIELLKRLKGADGSLRLCALSDKVKSVFEITKLHTLFDIRDTREAALEGFE